MDIGPLTGSLEIEDQFTSILKQADALIKEFGDTAAREAKRVQAFNEDLMTMGKGMSVYVTAPIIAMGTAAVVAGYQLEGAYSVIAKKSGETGVALDGLKSSFDNVFGNVSANADVTAKALTEVHTRLGLTGSALEQTTIAFIKFAEVNGVEVANATKTVSTLIKALELDAGQAAGLMDKLTYASQQSGMSVTELGEGVIKGGVAFREMGFGVDESLALFSQFAKVGANVTDVTSSLHRTMARLAKEGAKDVKVAFKELLDEIKEAPTFTDAVRKSVAAFGAQAGPKLVEEIRGGTYEIDSFVKKLQEVEGQTKKTDKNSQDLAGAMGELRNQVTLAIGPIGIQLINVLKDLTPLLKDVLTYVVDISKAFSDLPKPVQLAAFGFLALLAAIGPLFMIGSQVLGVMTALAGAAGFPSVSAAATAMGVTLGGTIAVFAGVALAIAGVTAALTVGYQAWMLYKEGQERGAANQRQAAVDTSNLARINSATGQSFKTLEEASDWMKKTGYLENLRKAQPVAKAAAAEVDNMRRAMDRLREGALTPLTAAQKANITELDKLGFSTQKIAKELGINEQAVELYTKSLDANEKAIKANGKATKKAAEDQKELDEFIVKTNRSIANGLATWSSFTTEIEKYTKRVADGIIGNDAVMRDAQRELNDIVHKEVMGRVNFELYQLDRLAYNSKLKLDENAANYAAAAQAIDDLTAKRKEMARLEDEIDSADDAFEGLTPDIVPQWKQQISAIGDMFGNMFEGINNKVAQVFKVAGSGLDFMVNKAKNFSEQLTAALGMAASIASTLMGDGGGKVGGAAVGALSGAAAGAGIGTMIAPGIGTAIGAGIGAVVGGITGWIGASRRAKEEAANLQKELKAMDQQIIATYGSTQALTEASYRVGMSLNFSANMTKEQTERFKEQADEMERRFKLVDGAVGKMMNGLTAVSTEITKPWVKLGEEIDEARKKSLAAEDALKKALGSLDDSQGSIDKLNELQDALQKAIDTENALMGKPSNNYTRAIDQMKPEESKALDQGFAQAQAEGYKGSIVDFLAAQVELYKTADEADSRLKTWLSAETIAMARFGGTVKQAESVYTEAISRMSEAERRALDAGMKGFKGTAEQFLAQQADLYGKVTEGDPRLKTWLSGATLEFINAKDASANYAEALRKTEEQAARAKRQLEDLGTQAIMTFAAAYKATGSYSQALAAIAPTLANLSASYKALGLTIDNAYLKALMIQGTVVKNNPTLIAAIDGQTDSLQGAAQMGMLNAETFAAMQRTGIELYTRLQAETAAAALANGDLGDQTRNALMPMQGYLQQAAEQARLLNLPLDDATQELINQSRELGIWKDKGKSAQDLLIDGMQKLVDKLDVVIGRILGMGSALNNLPDPTVTITTEHRDVYTGGDGGEPTSHEMDGEPIYRASGGMVPRGSDVVPAMLTPGERVLSVSQNRAYEQENSLDELVKKLTEAGGATVHMTVNVNTLDSTGIEEVMDKKVFPSLVSKLRRGGGDLRDFQAVAEIR